MRAVELVGEDASLQMGEGERLIADQVGEGEGFVAVQVGEGERPIADQMGEGERLIADQVVGARVSSLCRWVRGASAAP